VQAGAVRLLVPLICLTGGYFIWQGSHLAGGAFQGGAVLSSALVLLLISDFLWLPRMHSLPLRLGLVLGPLVFMAAAVWGMLVQGSLLQFSPEQAGAFLLLIETACGISIGLTLAAYFAGGRPLTDLREEPYSAGRGEEGPDGD
jgi:multisubunit Na+/H+ antiporter MnhB subunit